MPKRSLRTETRQRSCLRFDPSIHHIAQQRPSWGLKAAPGALVASHKRTGQVVYNMLTPHMHQFMGRCVGAIKKAGLKAKGAGQFSIIVGANSEVHLSEYYQPSDDPTIVDHVVAEARRITDAG